MKLGNIEEGGAMEKRKHAFVRLVPDTSEIDGLKEKLDELNEALEKANSLAKELAAVETIHIGVAIQKKD